MKLPGLYFRLPVLQSLLIAVAVLASGCAAPPIKPVQPPSTLSVAQARSALVENDGTEIPPGSRVLWGGVILKAENLTDATMVEILGYPVDRRQRPLPGEEPQGRFIAEFDGFVEPLEFPNGRYVTVFGPLADPVTGLVGEASYQYPVVSVEQSHLWRPQDLPRPPRISFGVGISVGN